MSVTMIKVKTDKEAFLQELLMDIERRKAQYKKSLYRVNERLTDEVASYVNSYFQESPNYEIEMKKCKRSKNVWDLIIIFL